MLIVPNPDFDQPELDAASGYTVELMTFLQWNSETRVLKSMEAAVSVFGPYIETPSHKYTREYYRYVYVKSAVE